MQFACNLQQQRIGPDVQRLLLSGYRHHCSGPRLSKVFARTSRPFQGRKGQPITVEDVATSLQDEDEDEDDFEDLTVTEDERLTQSYLESLGTEEWEDDPPDHKSGYVAIVGKPNAGKSTLMNALVGQKLSIVTPKAQTTRHRILSLINDASYQMVLLDTPGIMATERNKLDRRMMKAVWQAARAADSVISIIDASNSPRDALAAMNQIFEAKEAKSLPILLVLNKVDLISKQELDVLVSWFQSNSLADKVIPISARFGNGVEDVKIWATEQLPQGPSLYPKDAVSEEPERFFIAEIVREQIFMQYREEIPYSSTAEVTDYETRPGAKDLVRVSVYVETEGQRGIVIGKGGSALKKLSTNSRLEIEDFLGKSIFLDISIKVQKEWRSDDSKVANFGY